MELKKSPVWHPYTPGIQGDEICIERGEGAILHTRDGRRIVDCISSWWVNIHGHAQPHIAQAIARQAEKLEQVIFAGFTHEPAERLASGLLGFVPGKMERVFFSDNGSTAIEVALKMALQHFHIKGEKRNRIVALRNAYHGDTFGAMAVGERGTFTQAFRDWLFEVDFIDVPYENLAQPASDEQENESLKRARQVLENPETAALILEPLLQGAGGMRMFSSSFLDQLMAMAQKAGVLVIADEVFTGFYRTGKAFACSGLDSEPDMVCLSKGLTGGFLPMGITLCNAKTAEPFAEKNYARTLYHGHSFTGNPLSCAAALASLDLCRADGFEQTVARLAKKQRDFAENLAQQFPDIQARNCGTITAITLGNEENGYDYTHPIRQRMYSFFMDRDLLIRPMGNVVYLAPPYCIEEPDLAKAHSAIEELLTEIRKTG